jgi:hypothetical protein
MQTLSDMLQAKDQQLLECKEELVTQMMERRQREEEVVNWSCILKYLLSTTSKLRLQIKQMERYNSGITNTGGTGTGIGRNRGGSGDVSGVGLSAMNSAAGTPTQQEAFSRLAAPDSVLSKYAAASSASSPAQDSPLARVRERMNMERSHDRRSRSSNTSRSRGHAPALESRLRRAQQQQQQQQQQHQQQQYQQHTKPQVQTAYGDNEESDVSDEYDAIGDDDEDGEAEQYYQQQQQQQQRQQQQRQQVQMSRSSKYPPTSSSSKRSSSPITRSHTGSPGSTVPHQVYSAKTTPNPSSGYNNNNNNNSNIAPSSARAKSVVKGLGVTDAKALAAAQVVDKVMGLTDEQLMRMDSVTREQVLLVRRDLGLDGSNSGAGAPTGGARRSARSNTDDPYSQI